MICDRCDGQARWQLCPARLSVARLPAWACSAHAVAMLAEEPGLTLVPVEAVTGLAVSA